MLRRSICTFRLVHASRIYSSTVDSSIQYNHNDVLYGFLRLHCQDQFKFFCPLRLGFVLFLCSADDCENFFGPVRSLFFVGIISPSLEGLRQPPLSSNKKTNGTARARLGGREMHVAFSPAHHGRLTTILPTTSIPQQQHLVASFAPTNQSGKHRLNCIDCFVCKFCRRLLVP